MGVSVTWVRARLKWAASRLGLLIGGGRLPIALDVFLVLVSVGSVMLGATVSGTGYVGVSLNGSAATW